jgi:hypothetical protein
VAVLPFQLLPMLLLDRFKIRQLSDSWLLAETILPAPNRSRIIAFWFGASRSFCKQNTRRKLCKSLIKSPLCEDAILITYWQCAKAVLEDAIRIVTRKGQDNSLAWRGAPSRAWPRSGSPNHNVPKGARLCKTVPHGVAKLNLE